MVVEDTTMPALNPLPSPITPAVHPPADPAVWLADGREMPVRSPVHRMHEAIEAQTLPAAEPSDALYPLWFRRTFPIVVSGAMWAGIAWLFLG
jgi:hypothetical protein